jgi:malonate-semialdehyde dehydrogenase (acetylating)/methylmalonate-semialdehyde dehydrogenase
MREAERNHYGTLKLFIDGKWRESAAARFIDDVNPTTGETIAEMPVATDDEIEAAAASAADGFMKWKAVPLRDKARMLFDLRERFEAHFERLCTILVQDHGRTWGEATGTLRRVIENIESACSACLLLTKGEQVNDLAKGLDQTMIWEPRGVFLIVTPSNIPMHAWSSYVPYALASGCSVIVSPSRLDPVCTDAIFRVVEEAGFPPGLMNLVYGGREVNAKLLEHPVVKGVGFIGSTDAGLSLHAQAARLGKESSINGNGKNHVVVMPDGDIDAAVDGLLRGCYGMAGQRCLGSDNIVIVGDAYDEVKEKFVRASGAVKLGYGLDDTVTLGPLVSAAGREKVLAYIETGLSEGARMVLDGRGKTPPAYPNGFFLAPTILDEVTPDMKIAREEAFGPVAYLMRAKDLTEAISWINDRDDYGHSACIFTKDGKTAKRFIKEADVGNVGINVPVPQPYAFFPLGSKNASAFGLAKSRIDSIRLFLDQKTVTERW